MMPINDYIQKKLRQENMDYVDPVTANRWPDEVGILEDNPNNRGGPLRRKLRSGEIHGAELVGRYW